MSRWFLVRPALVFLALSAGLALWLTACGGPGDDPKPSAQDRPVRGLQLLDHVPRDPLAAWVVRMDDPVSAFNDMLDVLGLVIDDPADVSRGPTVEQRLEALDEALGLSLRQDLLAHVGSELAVALDVQAIDPLVVGGLSGRLDLGTALGGSGLVFLVADEAAVRRGLAKIFERAGGRIRGPADGPWVAEFPVPGLAAGAGGGPPPELEVHFGVRGGVAAIGLSRRFLSGAIDGLAAGEGLQDGEDFARVFEALDEVPQALSYLNLPRLRSAVEGSGLLRMALSANPRSRKMMEVLVNEETMQVGIGQTIVETGPGARTSTFGPAWLAGGPKLIGLVAALAIDSASEALEDTVRKRPPEGNH